MKHIQAFMQSGCRALFADEHRYGHGFCAALVPEHMLETMSDLTTGGDSFNPYGFASWVKRSKHGIPVAYGTDLATALAKLDQQLAGDADVVAERIAQFDAALAGMTGSTDCYSYFNNRAGL